MQILGQKRSHEMPSDFLGQPCCKLVREGWGLLPVRVARLSRKEIRIKPLKFPTFSCRMRAGSNGTFTVRR